MLICGLLSCNKVADPRLREDAIKAKVAAASVVERAIEEDEDDILSSDFVQLNIGDQSPMVRKSDLPLAFASHDAAFACYFQR